jgi:UDP-4-amino-4,6-dideoxy-N-acetyl-beta-L-altrosamine transaminase
MIYYGRQEITQEDIDNIIEVLKSDFLTQGPSVSIFEKKVANYCNVSHAVAVNSATSALHIACKALGLGNGDWLWTSPNSFVASANCGLYCGANIDFVEIDPMTYNMSADSLLEKLKISAKSGKLPKIVIPVHFAGQSCEMESIYQLSKEYGFRIIEDASHAIGGKYQGKPVGNCRYSDITVFSFHPVKIITTGEGGMALTNDRNLEELMLRYRSHGITSNLAYMDERPSDEIWNYQQIKLGFNYRITDIQAALGTSQMNRLDEYIQRRHVIAKRYDFELASLPVSIPFQHPDVLSSYHLYPILLNLDKMKKTQRQVYKEMYDSGLQANIHYIPIYRHPFYQKLGFPKGYCQQSENYHKCTISLPMYPTLSEDLQTEVINKLINIIF